LSFLSLLGHPTRLFIKKELNQLIIHLYCYHHEEIFKLIRLYTKVDYKTEVLSGLTVALALIPEAVAFALIAGLSPLTGLYAAFVVGLVTSILGGRPGMISGATGAIAVVIVALAISHGPEYIFATVVLAGIIQILAGLFKLGKLMRIVPHP
jgi:SulP family sulfate permease